MATVGVKGLMDH